ncbi:Unknown protein sequence [Pseudomonas syringae pv. maculicola]|nr:Unknown protein sequence [Pseudomonas syringae pv. maculicola]
MKPDEQCSFLSVSARLHFVAAHECDPSQLKKAHRRQKIFPAWPMCVCARQRGA